MNGLRIHPLRWCIMGVMLSAVSLSSSPAAGMDGTAPISFDPSQYHVAPVMLENGLAMDVDARLDEPFWSDAVVAGRFVQAEPLEGIVSTEQTEVRIARDDKGLYFGIMCYDTAPDLIVANEMRRDEDLDANDEFQIVLDTFHDHRNGYYFSINPLGARRDARITDEGRVVNDDWDCVWEVAARVTPQGWCAEVRIPFSQLNYAEAPDAGWGVNFSRRIRRKNEITYWVPLRQDLGRRAFFRLSRAGHLEQLGPLPHRFRGEIIPYTITGHQVDRSEAPFIRQSVLDAGVDLKYNLTSNLVANLTLNTDFAQVENDQEQVNLTRFSLFLPEKRNFFLEGAGIFQFGERPPRRRSMSSDQLFYSRRLGLEEGEEVPIIAGAKITGKMGSTSLGFLDVVTQATELEEKSLPRQNFAVLRMKRDIFRRSSVGLVAIDRSQPGGGDYHHALGLDAQLNRGDNFGLAGYVAATRNPGMNANNLAYAATARWDTDELDIVLGHKSIGDNFDPRVGFYRRTGIRRSEAEVAYGFRPDWPMIRRIRVGPGIQYVTDQGNMLITREWGIKTRVFFENSSFVFLGLGRNYDRLIEAWEFRDDIVIPAGGYRFTNLRFFALTDESRPISFYARGQVGGFHAGNRTSTSFGATIRPNAHLYWELDAGVYDVRLPEAHFRTYLGSLRLVYALTTNLYFKTFVQWNDDREIISSNVLCRYIYRPGSELYLVYNQAWDAPRGASPHGVARTVMLKISHWISS